jgi:serine/threonine-protein kinase
MIGTVVGNYRIIERIGEGGLGQMFRAVDAVQERDVAVRVLPHHLTEDAAQRQQFRSEITALTELNHPNVARLYDFLEHQGDYYWVTEFVDGETFESLLKRQGALPLRVALELFCQALQGFEHAHENHIVHGDIQPSHLMLNSSGVVKITDFGVARVLGSRRLTKMWAGVPTLAYLSPEQAQGEEPDERSDIYALGILLYQMVTGHTPFNNTSNHDITRAHLEDGDALQPTLTPPRQWAAELPEDIERAIEMALEKNPAARFQQVRDLRQMLERTLEQLPQTGALIRSQARLPRVEPIVPAVSVAPEVRPTQTPPQAVLDVEPTKKRLSPTLLIVGGFVLLFVVIIVVVVTMMMQPDPSARHNGATQPPSTASAQPTSGDEPSNRPRALTRTQPTKDKPTKSGAADQNTTKPASVVTTTTKTWTQSIPYGTTQRKTAELPAGSARVKQKGQAGVKRITIEITFQQGREVSRRTVNEKVVKPAVPEVVLVGTAPKQRAASPPRSRRRGDNEPPLPPRLDSEPPLPPSIGRR